MFAQIITPTPSDTETTSKGKVIIFLGIYCSKFVFGQDN